MHIVSGIQPVLNKPALYCFYYYNYYNKLQVGGGEGNWEQGLSGIQLARMRGTGLLGGHGCEILCPEPEATRSSQPTPTSPVLQFQSYMVTIPSTLLDPGEILAPRRRVLCNSL